MTEDVANLTLEIVRAMRGELGDFRSYMTGELSDLKLRLSTVEHHLGTIDARLARVDDRLDGIEKRAARIEQRLDLVEGPS
jgi:hypothetical protein